MKTGVKKISVIAILTGLLLVVVCSGFAAVSVERQERRQQKGEWHPNGPPCQRMSSSSPSPSRIGRYA